MPSTPLAVEPNIFAVLVARPHAPEDCLPSVRVASYSYTREPVLGCRHLHGSRVVRAKQLVLVTADHRLHTLQCTQPPDNAHNHKVGGDSSALTQPIQHYLQPRESSILDTRCTCAPLRKSGKLTCGATSTVLVNASTAHGPHRP